MPALNTRERGVALPVTPSQTWSEERKIGVAGDEVVDGRPPGPTPVMAGRGQASRP